MGLVDTHCHLAALPTGKNGCLLSARMLKSPVFKLVAWNLGLPLHDPETANRLYIEKLVAELSSSKRVSGAVLLAMDGVYGSDGRLDELKTDFLISNEHLFEAIGLSTGKGPHLYAGPSINPTRRDAIDELERCAARGAVLVKVLPNSQCFDPGDAKLRPFYKALARLKVALLSHIGFEFSLIGQDQSVGDLARLATPLEEGATVIAAHGCSTGAFLVEKHLDVASGFAKRFPNFFTDLSALTLPNRLGALLRLRRRPELFDRFVFGTDYPLPCFSWGLRGATGHASRFDRMAAVLESLGLPPGKSPLELLGRVAR